MANGSDRHGGVLIDGSAQRTEAAGVGDFGLNERARRMIEEVLARHDRVSEARVFGSRALGTQRPESDIDIALYGDVDEKLAARIAGELEELPLPYTFDVQAYANLRHPPLRDHIDRVGRNLYRRSMALDADR